MPRTLNQAVPTTTTYIGIAFLTVDGLSTQVAVVLSDHVHFNIIRSCGMVIESVNGWVESWRPNSPTAFEPYLILMGIITVAVVHKPASEISNTIHSLGWNAQRARSSSNGDSLMHRYSEDYVRRAILHLCQKRTIGLPLDESNFDEFIMDSLVQIREKHASKPMSYHVISLVEDISGRTNF